MTNTIDQELIDDAKAARIYKTMGGIDFQLNVSVEKLAKFAQLQRERQVSAQEPVATVKLVQVEENTWALSAQFIPNCDVKHGDKLFTTPPQPQTAKDALEQAAKICDERAKNWSAINSATVLTDEIMFAAKDIRALIQTEKGE